MSQYLIVPQYGYNGQCDSIQDTMTVSAILANATVSVSYIITIKEQLAIGGLLRSGHTVQYLILPYDGYTGQCDSVNT